MRERFTPASTPTNIPQRPFGHLRLMYSNSLLAMWAVDQLFHVPEHEFGHYFNRFRAIFHFFLFHYSSSLAAYVPVLHGCVACEWRAGLYGKRKSSDRDAQSQDVALQREKHVHGKTWLALMVLCCTAAVCVLSAQYSSCTLHSEDFLEWVYKVDSQRLYRHTVSIVESLNTDCCGSLLLPLRWILA